MLLQFMKISLHLELKLLLADIFIYFKMSQRPHKPKSLPVVKLYGITLSLGLVVRKIGIDMALSVLSSELTLKIFFGIIR